MSDQIPFNNEIPASTNVNPAYMLSKKNSHIKVWLILVCILFFVYILHGMGVNIYFPSQNIINDLVVKSEDNPKEELHFSEPMLVIKKTNSVCAAALISSEFIFKTNSLTTFQALKPTAIVGQNKGLKEEISLFFSCLEDKALFTDNSQ